MRLVIKGPFTEDEVRRIAAVVQQIESTRPEETFDVIVDAEETDVEVELERVMQLPPGYERHIKEWKR